METKVEVLVEVAKTKRDANKTEAVRASARKKVQPWLEWFFFAAISWVERAAKDGGGSYPIKFAVTDYDEGFAKAAGLRRLLREKFRSDPERWRDFRVPSCRVEDMGSDSFYGPLAYPCIVVVRWKPWESGEEIPDEEVSEVREKHG